MIRIGLLSDTHGYIDESLKYFFKDVDEIWHAGDIGSLDALNTLRALKPCRAVFGNVDGQDVRVEVEEIEHFVCEGVDVFMTHIGGYPPKYDKKIRQQIIDNPPKLFITGHSHILKIIYDDKLDLLHINPGAAGFYGWHKKSTCVRFTIEQGNIKDLEIKEFPKRKPCDANA
ncbi:MAG: metallophosphoesterase family protein [Bacteroidales bacterium]